MLNIEKKKYIIKIKKIIGGVRLLFKVEGEILIQSNDFS